MLKKPTKLCTICKNSLVDITVSRHERDGYHFVYLGAKILNPRQIEHPQKFENNR